MVHSSFETIVLLYHDWEYKVIMLMTNDHPAEDDDASESELGQGQYTNEEKKIVIGKRTKRKEILILLLPYHTGSSVRALRHQSQHRKEGGGVWMWCYVITEGGCQSLFWLHGDRFDLLWWWREMPRKISPHGQEEDRVGPNGSFLLRHRHKRCAGVMNFIRRMTNPLGRYRL